MINQQQIQRLVSMKAYRRLIERILPAGRCRSVQAVERLSSVGSAAVAGIALALIRTCELSYSPTSFGQHLMGRLMAMRRAGGLFGESDMPSIGASAVAIRAMLDWRDTCKAVGFCTARMDEAIDESISALAALQNADGLLAGDAVESAIALMMLGDKSIVRAALDVARLDAAIHRSEVISVDLSQYAHAMAA